VTLYAGLMSGTSLDGIDVAFVRLEGRGERPSAAGVESFHSVPYDDAFRDRLRRACEAGRAEDLCRLDFELGRRFAAALARGLEAAGLESGDVAAVGCAGQTVWHEPPTADRPGSTLQLGEGAVIAEQTGITVVEDFRVRDVAAGGHGAPISAYFDHLLLSAPDRGRGILNLGGMGNLTALPAGSADATPIAFDTGPGVVLIDAAARWLTGGRARFDEDGRMAASGSALEEAVEAWLEDPFFREAPPRTTGRERFGPARLEAWLEERLAGGDRPEDLLASLTEVTAAAASSALTWVPFDVEELYLCGGGARNPELARRVAARVAPRPVRTLDALGWDGDAREAAAFALLARQHLLGYPAGAPWATGARGARVLGKLVPA
jgi:anhydro-N-acetylmuramic acid kinase